jgi:hypothetical protein
MSRIGWAKNRVGSTQDLKSKGDMQMPVSRKILWVVNYNTLEDFFAKAIDIRATGVAIRTDNNLVRAIPKFHAAGLKVYGWRWPSARADPATNEAAKVARLLQDADMDGYFVDPEGAPGQHYDWDQSGLAALAEDFSSTIKTAAPEKLFGVTSHYMAKFTFPKIPWASFFKHADVFLPQSYWRSTGGMIGHGDAADNYDVGIDRWTRTGAQKDKIVPMGGEIGVSKASDINSHMNAAKSRGIDELHFYTTERSVKPSVWDAIRSV